mmetsp:Transcript_75095/g.244140  ORF Transcript_75095/g.244140 Transcript_75095/m.244140 type:complete len:226 (+) Transcript_75095:182-859(+)
MEHRKIHKSLTPLAIQHEHVDVLSVDGSQQRPSGHRCRVEVAAGTSVGRRRDGIHCGVVNAHIDQAFGAQGDVQRRHLPLETVAPHIPQEVPEVCGRRLQRINVHVGHAFCKLEDNPTHVNSYFHSDRMRRKLEFGGQVKELLSKGVVGNWPLPLGIVEYCELGGSNRADSRKLKLRRRKLSDALPSCLCLHRFRIAPHVETHERRPLVLRNTDAEGEPPLRVGR